MFEQEMSLARRTASAELSAATTSMHARGAASSPTFAGVLAEQIYVSRSALYSSPGTGSSRVPRGARGTFPEKDDTPTTLTQLTRAGDSLPRLSKVPLGNNELEAPRERAYAAAPISTGRRKGDVMLLRTSWKVRPMGPEAVKRMMDVWGKIEADTAENPDVERLCWYVYTDGSGGFTVNRVADNDSALAFGLEVALALEEFLEMETRPVLDLESAMPAIAAATQRMNG